MRIGVTGAAGFIGMHLVDSLLNMEHKVIGVDSMVPSYGGDWSSRRAKFLKSKHNFDVKILDLSSTTPLKIANIFREVDVLVHLGAWPGVRQGQSLPHEYASNNVYAFSNILEVARIIKPQHFLYASSSSIYGDLASSGPVKESSATGLNLKSYYAATKWMNETEARASQQLVDFPISALRFFTVYGPWGRPDMAYWNFLERIIQNVEISLYGVTGGSRNFTNVNDAIGILTSLIKLRLTPEHREFNIACGQPEETINFLNLIADAIGIVPKIRTVERPTVDVEKTWADLTYIQKFVDLPVQTPLSLGTSEFVNWFKENRYKCAE